MYKWIRKFFIFFSVFIFTLIIVDLFLSYFYDKEIYELQKNKIDIIPQEKSRKQIDKLMLPDIGNVPYWETNYRWPYINYKKNKERKCRIVWLWDSVIWWSWVEATETYMYHLQIKLWSSELLNYWIPWSDSLQQMIKYNKEWLEGKNDLLIWHIREDDNHIYKNINWVLYDSNIVLNGAWEVFLFRIIPNDTNDFFIKYSYIYNKLLTIKYNKQLSYKKTVDNNVYIVWEIKKFIKDKKNENKKIILLLSPVLAHNLAKSSNAGINPQSPFYNEIQKTFSWIENVNILYLEEFFYWMDIKDIRYDDCCHFNISWHKIIAEKLYDYIKINNLLDEKCY